MAATAPRRRAGLLNLRGSYDTLLAFFDHMVANGFLGEEQRAFALVGNEPKLLLDVFARYQPPKTVKLIAKEEI